MSSVTISVPEALLAKIETRARAAGYTSKEDYLWDLVRADSEQAERDAVLASRVDGPSAPLEHDWKQRVRDDMSKRASTVILPSSKRICLASTLTSQTMTPRLHIDGSQP